MASFSLDSKIKAVLRDPAAKAVIDEYMPDLADTPSLKMIQMMSLRKLLSYPESAEVAKFADEIDEKLKAL